VKIWLTSMVRSKLCLTSMVRSKICEAGRGLLSIMVVRENGLRNMVKRNSLHLPGRRRLSLLACARRHGRLNLSYSASAAEARLLQGHSNPGTLSENKQRCSCNASKPCRQVSQLLPGLLLLLQLLLLPLLLLLLAPAPAPAPCSLLLAPALAHAPAAAAVAEPTSGPHWACPG